MTIKANWTELVTLPDPIGTSCDNPPPNDAVYRLRIPDKQGGWPAQWLMLETDKMEFSHCYTDDVGRLIYEFYDGTCFTWQSWAHDFLPLLT